MRGCEDKGRTCGARAGAFACSCVGHSPPIPLDTRPPQGPVRGPRQSLTGNRKRHGNMFGLHSPEDSVCWKGRLFFFNAIPSKRRPNDEGGVPVQRARAGKAYQPAQEAPLASEGCAGWRTRLRLGDTSSQGSHRGECSLSPEATTQDPRPETGSTLQTRASTT